MPGLAHPALKRVQAEKARVLRLSNPQETVALGLVYSMLPLNTERAKEPKPQPPVEEMTRTADPADAVTPHQREVIRPPAPVNGNYERYRTPEPEPETVYHVTLTRKLQWTGSASKMSVSVDHSDVYELSVGNSCGFSVKPGRHTFIFWLNLYKNVKYPIEISVDHDMDITFLNVIEGVFNAVKVMEGPKVLGIVKHTKMEGI